MCQDTECSILKHMKDYRKQYYEKNRDKLLQLHKDIYINNKESILLRNKEYQKKHKEKLQKKQNTKTECECGGSYTYANKTKHLQTKKHINFISSKENEESQKEI